MDDHKVIPFKPRKLEIAIVDELELWRSMLSVIMKGYSLHVFDSVNRCLEYTQVNTVDCVIMGLGASIDPGTAKLIEDRHPNKLYIYLPDRHYPNALGKHVLTQKYAPLSAQEFKRLLTDLIETQEY